MSALAQLLDKPATPINYIAATMSTMARSPRSSKSKPRSCEGGGIPIDYNDLDPDDLEYARPNYKKKTPNSPGGSRRSSSSLSTTLLSSSSSLVSTSSAGNFRLGRDLPVKVPRRVSKTETVGGGSSPGSRLSLKATSLPQPAVLSGVQQYQQQQRGLELLEKRFKLVPAVSSTGPKVEVELESVNLGHQVLVDVKMESPVSVEGEDRKTSRIRKQRHSAPTASTGKVKEEVILGLNDPEASSPSDVDHDIDPDNENGDVDSVVESSFDTLIKGSSCDRTTVVGQSRVSAALSSPRRKPPCIKTVNKCKNKIKRPLNAFMVWSKLHRRKIMDMDPTIHHSLISKHLGAGWKALSESDRKPFYDEAKKLSELHTQIYPDYKYQPRKRSKNSLDQEASGSGDSLVNVHSISSSSDVFKTYSDVPKTAEIDCISLKLNPNVPFVRYTVGTIGCLPRRNNEGCLDLSMKRSNASYSDSDESIGSSGGASQPLNMSTKSMTKTSEDQGLKSWSKIYDDSEESDEERLVIDETDA